MAEIIDLNAFVTESDRLYKAYGKAVNKFAKTKRDSDLKAVDEAYWAWRAHHGDTPENTKVISW
jgi:hypothetical protein